jgi:hypothetical protein
VLFILLITLAVGFLVYRIIADGFRRPQSERLGCFGAFGYFVLIILDVWLATTLAPASSKHVARMSGATCGIARQETDP